MQKAFKPIELLSGGESHRVHSPSPLGELLAGASPLLLLPMLVLVLPPPRCLRRLLLLLPLLLEPIVLQPHRTEIPTLPCSCP